MSVLAVASVVEAIAWTLLHFLWQGAAVALVYSRFLRWPGKRSPQVRYVEGNLGL